jgi:hypothetical protein
LKVKNKVLMDHIRKGKVFYPPFTYDGGENRFTEVNWRADILPELFWLAVIIKCEGFLAAKQLTCHMAVLADRITSTHNAADFGTISGYNTLSTKNWEGLKAQLGKYKIFEPLQRALSPLCLIYPDCSFSNIFDLNENLSAGQAVNLLGPTLDECLFRNEKTPILAQGLYYEILLSYGKLNLNGVAKHNTDLLMSYPETDEAQHIAGFMRCNATSLPVLKSLMKDGDGKLDWPQYFWSRGRDLGDCVPVKKDGIYPSDVSGEFLFYSAEAFKRYHNQTRGYWDTIHENYPYNIYDSLKDDVLLGLAARVYRLVVQIISFTPNWTEDIGQVYLRMILESFIYYKWLKCCGSDSDFKMFYDYGLGQQKLQNEHKREYFKHHGVDEDSADEIVRSMDFLRGHKLPEFVPVNVGSPLRKNLGKLAEDAGIKEFYSLIYSPTSSVVHGMYDSLDQFYLCECLNPFHCRHRIPYYWYKSPLSTYGVLNSVQIFDWILKDLLDECGIDIPESMPGHHYVDMLNDEDRLKEFSERDDINMKCKYMSDTVANELNEDVEGKS